MKFLLPAILSVFIVSSVFAQDDVKEKDYSAHGLQFQIGENFQLQSFEGLTLSYLYRTNNNYTLRFGISTSFSSKNQDVLRRADSTQSYSTDNDNSFGVLLSCDFIFTLAKKDNFSMIAGGGPFVSFGGADSEKTEEPDVYVNKRYVTFDISKWSAGAGLLLGVNYNLTNSVVISGEYGLKIGYSSYTENVTEKRFYSNNIIKTKYGERNINGFKIVNGNVRMGIAVYF